MSGIGWLVLPLELGGGGLEFDAWNNVKVIDPVSENRLPKMSLEFELEFIWNFILGVDGRCNWN